MPFDGTNLDESTQLLIEGRERVERGWCQGKMRGWGKVCAMGAIWPMNRIITETAYEGAYARLHRAVGGRPEWGVPQWNDVPGRTQDEVLAAFDKAIADESAP